MFDRKGDRKYLNKAESRAFLKVIKEEKDKSKRAFFLTLFFTGCRISEGLNVTPERIDLSNKSIVFETLKRRKRGHFRAVPIPTSLIKLLRKIVGKHNQPKRIWKFSRSTAYRSVKQAMRESKISGTKTCPKGLRHSFAIACIAKNIPVTKVKKWLGHARIETTSIYVDVVDEEERELAKRRWKDF